MSTSLKEQLKQAIPELTDRDFATYESDLYVVAYPKVCDWLKNNYRWWGNVSRFRGAEGSDWNGAGKPCLDIPFAHLDAYKERTRKKKCTDTTPNT